MKTKLTALSLLGVLLFSCQKEISLETPGSGGGGNGNGSTDGKLVKSVEVTGNDTLTTLYGYDSQDRLQTMTVDGKSNGMTMHQYRKVEWDAAGRVTTVRQYLVVNGMSSDTAVNNIHYPNSTTMEFDYSVNTMGMMGFTTVDSSVYTYSGGKMLKQLSYTYTPLLGLPPVESTRAEFTYDGSGRVSILKLYADLSASPTGGGPLSHVLTQTYTYGASLNALPVSSNAAQNFWINGMPSTTNDALTKLQVDDITTPANSLTMNMTYVLGGGNKPLSSTKTGNNGLVSKSTFYYQ